MKAKPSLTTTRAAEIFDEMLWYRREFCADTDFIKMPQVWETLANDLETLSLKFFGSNKASDFTPTAGIVAFAGRTTLTVHEELFRQAKKGCRLSNYLLAHELGHLALEHHAKSATIKNFQLHRGEYGMSNMPPTVEELEANYAAVFFQCGVALQNPNWHFLDLALRAFSDPEAVRNAQLRVQLNVFQQALSRKRSKYTRVIL